MDILTLYLATHDLKTVYDIDGKYEHVKVGDHVTHKHVVGTVVSGWVVDLPGCVQEGERMLREEREWLLEQGKQYAHNKAKETAETETAEQTGDAVILYIPATGSEPDRLATVFDSERRYRSVKMGTSVSGTYALSLWYDCTVSTMPNSAQVKQLSPSRHQWLLKQGKEYAQQKSIEAPP